MSLTLNTRVYDYLKNGIHQLNTVVFGGLRRWMNFSPFALRKGQKYTGGISISVEDDIVLPSGDVERRSDSIAVQFIGHSASDVADFRSLMSDLNSFVQSADFATYLVGKTTF
jgi:hypothetical protein